MEPALGCGRKATRGSRLCSGNTVSCRRHPIVARACAPRRLNNDGMRACFHFSRGGPERTLYTTASARSLRRGNTRRADIRSAASSSLATVRFRNHVTASHELGRSLLHASEPRHKTETRTTRGITKVPQFSFSLTDLIADRETHTKRNLVI